MSIKGVHTYMHRFSYELHFGSVPEGLFVLHHCDNPSCVRPDHLFLGTNQDNMADKVLKGRHPRGNQVYNAKLNPDAVRDIQTSGLSNGVLAKKYNVSPSAVREVRIGRNWKHIR